MTKLRKLAAWGFLMVSTVTVPALADTDTWHGDIHRFRDYDAERWQSGHWTHEIHDGRNGWWWVVGPSWYAYPEPAYPFPDPYIPPGIVVPAAPSQATQYWYFCSRPVGYYPYVPVCSHRWRRVASTVVIQPQPAPPLAVPAPAAQMPPPTAPTVDLQAADERQVAAFTAEIKDIRADAPHAAERLADLQKRVKTFHQTLFKRTYNAMGNLKETEKLETRISDRRALMLHPSPAKPAPKTANSTLPVAPIASPAPPPNLNPSTEPIPSPPPASANH